MVRKIILPVVSVFLLAQLLFAQPPEMLPRLPLDAGDQLTDGLIPKVTLDSGSERKGRFRIADNGWWMFFLHLRPLENAPVLNAEVVHDLILNFWYEGIETQGELTGEEGTLHSGDNTVFRAEALFMKGTVKTRFFVWDEPALNRRMIADCNINLHRGTPDSILTVVEEQIAFFAQSGIDRETVKPPMFLSESAEFPLLQVSLLHPAGSRAAVYPGFDDKRGDFPPEQWSSIWVLPVGIDWRFDLAWGPFEDVEPEEWIAALLPDSLSGETVMVTDSVNINEIYENQWIGEAFAVTRLKDQSAESRWRIAAATWDHRGRTFRTIVACQIFEDWYGIPFDGTVDQDTMNAKTIRWLNRIHTAPIWMGAAN